MLFLLGIFTGIGITLAAFYAYDKYVEFVLRNWP